MEKSSSLKLKQVLHSELNLTVFEFEVAQNISLHTVNIKLKVFLKFPDVFVEKESISGTKDTNSADWKSVHKSIRSNSIWITNITVVDNIKTISSKNC